MAKEAQARSEESILETDESEQIQEPAAQPTDEEIAVRAYHIYLERGSTEGNPDDDWLQAKRELSEGNY